MALTVTLLTAKIVLVITISKTPVKEIFWKDGVDPTRTVSKTERICGKVHEGYSVGLWQLV